jgi:hypothetical protein
MEQTGAYIAATGTVTLEVTDPAAVELLMLAAFLAPDDLPMPLLVAHHSQLSEPLSSATRDPMTLADAVAALRRYYLIGVTGDGLSVHQLLQTVIRGTLAPEAERTWAAAAVHLLYASFPVDSDEVGAWDHCQRLLPHMLAGVKHAQRLKVEPK